MSKPENCYSEVHQHIKSHLIELDESLKTDNYINFDLAPIYDEISPETKKFLSEIDIDTQKKYFYCLSNVVRWENHVFNNITKNLIDTDYVHVLEMLKISSEIRILDIKSINFSEVEQMIILHDGGEIITSDMSNNQPEDKQDFIRFIKKLEPKVFNRFVLGQIEDKQQQNSLINLYDKYEHRLNNPDDTNSHLVKLIDMIQGNDFGLKNVYQKDIIMDNYHDKSYVDKSDVIVETFFVKEINQFKLVLDSIKNSNDKKKIFDFYENRCSQYIKYGFEDIYFNNIEKVEILDPTLNSLLQ